MRILLVAVAILIGADLLHRLARRLVRVPVRPDGAPSLPLVRLSAAIDIGMAVAILVVTVLTRDQWAHLARYWPADPLPALLFGALGGLFLHTVDCGSALPIAALRRERTQSANGPRSSAGPATVLLFLGGEIASELMWRGFVLAALARVLPGVVALLITSGAYGLRREEAGQDHPILGALDGLLLGILLRLTRSLPAVILAHLIADVFAYVSAADRSEGELVSQVAQE